MLLAFPALALAAMAVPVAAQTIEQLDALSDVTMDENAGIQFARDQASRSEWLEAIGTLERVLAEHPKSNEAKRLQALYLCTVDDRLGGAVILAKLNAKDFPKGALDEVFAQCRQPQQSTAPEAGANQ